MQLRINFNRYRPWEGAINTLNKIRSAGKLDAFEAALEELYPDGLDEGKLNDLLWFEPDYCLSLVGLPGEDEDIEEGFVEEAVDEEVAHSMDREELKQIIKQIIERDTKNGDWFDVDTIAYDVHKEYPNVKTDTDEFYDLEIECIAEANEDAETEDDLSQYRIVKVSYCSDDYDINVEFGIIDPEEEECDVVDQEWLLKPGQTVEDLENYLYDKVGVTNLDIGDPEVITPDQADTEYKGSQKF